MNVRVIRKDRWRRLRMEQVVGVAAVRDVNVVSVVTKRMSESVNVDRVASKTPGRVKRGHVKEVQGPTLQSMVIFQ